MTGFVQKRAVLAACRHLVAAGLTRGTSGNVSVRVPGGFLITPTGMFCDQMDAGDLVTLDDSGSVVHGLRAPSSEWRIHRDIYATRGDAAAVVHTHPPFCCTIASLRHDLPAVHYMIAVAGGARVRCARYAMFGTAELSANALEALDGGRACLLANHGLLALGSSLDEAIRISSEIELVAEIYWRSLAAGTPVVLDDDEMARVVERFRDYGQPR